jgi:hypothetical protein
VSLGAAINTLALADRCLSRCQLVDLNNPITPDVLSTAWRERLSLNSPSTGSVDVAVRDRDHKLLAWLEYAEMIAEGESHLGPECRSFS